jgi:hypothetical protein
MMIEKTHVNATENYLLGEPIRDKIENTVLDGMTFGQMYRWFQSEGYGRCTSKVFVDTNNERAYASWLGFPEARQVRRHRRNVPA